MPNWSYTCYHIVGDSEEVATLKNTLDQLSADTTPVPPMSFGHLWLGNIVKAYGGKTDTLYLRGEVLDYELIQPGLLQLSVEAAWCEPSEWRAFMQGRMPKTDFYWMSEEPGMCVYQKHDDIRNPHFHDNYILEIYGCGIEHRGHYITFEEAAKDVKEILKLPRTPKTMKSAKKALGQFQSQHEDLSYCFEKYVRV